MRSLYMFTAETQRKPRSRREGPEISLFLALRFLRVLCVSAVLCFAPLTAKAQMGVITGRVVSEDGSGIPNMTVILSQVAASRSGASGVRPERTVTDSAGNFKFENLEPRHYSVSVAISKGYIYQPLPVSERRSPYYYRIGDNVTFTLIKGGVITGRVTTSTGEPMIGVQVSAMMVRDIDGRPLPMNSGGRPRPTDDRGVYRLYGLRPGAYVVFTRGNSSMSQISPYDGGAPTYYPSSTRETAVEITVANSDEATGIDIRYRGERGHTISGVVTGVADPAQPNIGVSITLLNASSGSIAGSGYARQEEGQNGFAINGLTDGEYEIIARRASADSGASASSPPRRVTVSGADVGGVELRLAPLASVSGKVVIGASPNACESKDKFLLDEIVVSARRDSAPSSVGERLTSFSIGGSLNERGEFSISGLGAGRYFFSPRLPYENWYVKSVTAPGAATSRRASSRSVATYDAGRHGITLRPADRASGLIVTISDGAAGLRGKVAPGIEGAATPARMMVHLTPAEPVSADEVLRYAETVAGKDGSFEFIHLAPGRYLLLARAAPQIEPGLGPRAPAAWDANERAKLRREALAAKNEIELQPCQRVKDHVLRFNH